MNNDPRFNKAPSSEYESPNSRWPENPSGLSLETESSTSFFQFSHYHLQLKQKKEQHTDRKMIPSTRLERLSYYRAFVSSPNRKQILVMQHVEFNIFIWHYVLDVFLKSLPHTYVHIFLAAYVPECHLFLPRMVPIGYGCKYMFVISAFFELLTYIDSATLMMNYAVSSIVYKNPWNKCSKREYIDPQRNITIYCYDLTEFSKIFQNATYPFNDVSYVTPDNRNIQLSQFAYFRLHRFRHFAVDMCYFVIIWVAAALCHKIVMKKAFWKTLHRFQWIVNFMDICSMIFLAADYLQGRIEDRKTIKVPVFSIAQSLWEADLDMLAESTTTPPVVHILTARSTQRIRPSEDSSMIIASNALIYIFRGLLLSRVKKYCESQVNTPLFQARSNRYLWFYFHTVYFATFYLGDLFTMGFFLIYLITELMVILVTYFCFIETIIQEWRKVKHIYIIGAMTVSGIIVFWFTDYMTRYIFFIYGKGFSTLMEILLLYILYPLGRLVDDYTFHFGVEPTKLRIWSLRLVPIFYSWKFYRLISRFFRIVYTSTVPKFPSSYLWSWSIVVAPFLLGILMIVYRYVLLQRKNWIYIFRPAPYWGPKEFQTRQMRKQFDSRNYIASQYPRLLSRYLLGKGEAESYKLEIRYDTGRKSTAIQDLQVVNEKKTR